MEYFVGETDCHTSDIGHWFAMTEKRGGYRMESLFSNILTASFHGSIVILAVMLLRVLLKKAPRKFICFLWVLAGLRLLMPFEIQSSLSLQPMPEVAQVQQWQAPAESEPAPRETFPVPPAQRQE